MKIYKPAVVEEMEIFYGDLLEGYKRFPIIRDHLSQLALRLWEGLQQDQSFAYTEINNYHPKYLGQPRSFLQGFGLDKEQCKETVAHQYGFAGWQAVEELKETPYYVPFEMAVNSLLNGQQTILQELIAGEADLLSRRSNYGHRATLLHYVASNGVELWRQKVPSNLVEMTAWLLEKGADRQATMKVYGGEFATLPLLMSSAHPFAAGLGKDLQRLFS